MACNLSRQELLSFGIQIVDQKCQAVCPDSLTTCNCPISAHRSEVSAMVPVPLPAGITQYPLFCSRKIIIHVDEIHVFNCKVINSKLRKCNRLKLYRLAQECHAKIREGVDCGISYLNSSNDLSVSLVFRNEVQLEEFEDKISELVRYRKRKAPGVDDHLDVKIAGMSRSRLPLAGMNLLRIYSSDYRPMDEDPSEDCDGDSTIYGSAVSAVDISDEVKLRLLDALSSELLFGSKIEKCHLKSQSAFPSLRNDPNNVLFMTRHLHEHFDGINKWEDVPSFLIEYVAHHVDRIQQLIDGKTYLLYETTVNAVFLSEMYKNVLAKLFRECKSINSTTIQFELYFENADKFKEYSEFKANETRLKWTSSRGRP